jgi:hypothetical protein
MACSSMGRYPGKARFPENKPERPKKKKKYLFNKINTVFFTTMVKINELVINNWMLYRYYFSWTINEV